MHPDGVLLLRRRGAGQEDAAAALHGGAQPAGNACPAPVRQHRCALRAHHRSVRSRNTSWWTRKCTTSRPDLIFCGRTLFGAKPAQGAGAGRPLFRRHQAARGCLHGGAERGAVEAGHACQDRAQRGRARPARAGAHLHHHQHRHRPQPADHGDHAEGRRRGTGWSACCTRSPSPASTAAASTTTGPWRPTPASTCSTPGDTPYENAQFLLFLCAVIQAVDDYQDLLRLSVALGRQRPPAGRQRGAARRRLHVPRRRADRLFWTPSKPTAATAAPKRP